jgi:hypothetical protein
MRGATGKAAEVTDPSPPAPQPPASQRRPVTRPSARRARRPSFKVTILAAAAGFLVVFELLAYQLRSGHDPALGRGQMTAQVQRASAGAGVRHVPASGAVSTRTSGASAVPATVATQSVANPPVAHHSRHAIATRTSGGGHVPGQAGRGDDGFEHEGSA